jgi:hypothetical protein
MIGTRRRVKIRRDTLGPAIGWLGRFRIRSAAHQAQRFRGLTPRMAAPDPKGAIDDSLIFARIGRAPLCTASN